MRVVILKRFLAVFVAVAATASIFLVCGAKHFSTAGGKSDALDDASDDGNHRSLLSLGEIEQQMPTKQEDTIGDGVWNEPLQHVEPSDPTEEGETNIFGVTGEYTNFDFPDWTNPPNVIIRGWVPPPAPAPTPGIVANPTPPPVESPTTTNPTPGKLFRWLLAYCFIASTRSSIVSFPRTYPIADTAANPLSHSWYIMQ